MFSKFSKWGVVVAIVYLFVASLVYWFSCSSLSCDLNILLVIFPWLPFSDGGILPTEKPLPVPFLIGINVIVFYTICALLERWMKKR